MKKMKAWNEKKITNGPRVNIKPRKDFKKLPKNYDKIVTAVDKLISPYLEHCKAYMPKPMYVKERTKLMNICREHKLTSKHLDGLLSKITQLTKIDPKQLEN